MRTLLDRYYELHAYGVGRLSFAELDELEQVVALLRKDGTLPLRPNRSTCLTCTTPPTVTGALTPIK